MVYITRLMVQLCCFVVIKDYFYLSDATSNDNVKTAFFGILKYREEWGYIDVRPSAHLFWWMYTVKVDHERPLLLWIEGGPGASSCGFGNFGQIGPKDLDLQDRPYTLLQISDLIFVDIPVGSGFSYVDDDSAFNTQENEIVEDLLVWCRAFFFNRQHLLSRPFYLFSLSYGSKIAVQFARTFANKATNLSVNFQGVTFGNGLINGIDSLSSMGAYYHSFSLIDANEKNRIDEKAEECSFLTERELWSNVTDCWLQTVALTIEMTGGTSIFNILKQHHIDLWSKTEGGLPDDSNNFIQKFFTDHRAQTRAKLNQYMNTVAKQKIGIIPENVIFEGQRKKVFKHLYADYLKPNYKVVDELLQRGVNIAVYVGQLNAEAVATKKWMSRLKWDGMKKFNKSLKTSFTVNNNNTSAAVDGFRKKYKNLQLWQILQAGHMSFSDAPPACFYMTQEIFKSQMNDNRTEER